MIVLLSDNSAPYLSFANALRDNLPAGMRATVLEHPDQLSSAAPQAGLIVAVGMKAAEVAASQTSTPVLAVMIPRMSYEDMLAQASAKTHAPAVSVIYLDQPQGRQIDFLLAALPGRHRIGLLYSAESRIDIVRLRQDVAQRGGSLVDRPVRSDDELYASLESILANSDVLLAIPDRMIYNSSNIRNILLTSYRHGIPLIGLSQAYVNAGALCAIFSTPEQLAAQAGPAVVSFAGTGQLPEPSYPAAFTIAVNRQVARSLEIELPSQEAILNGMNNAKEGGR